MSDQTIINQEKYLDGNGVSYLYLLIKGKLTEFFKSIFVEQKTGWGLSQNDFTNDLKLKLESIDSVSGSNDNIKIIEAETFDEEEMTGTISQETADIINNYTATELLYFNILDMFLAPLSGSTPEGPTFAIIDSNSYIRVKVNTGDLTFVVEVGESPRLDENGKLTIDQIPNLGFYDDVVEGYYKPSNGLFYKTYNTQIEEEESRWLNPVVGETGKLYIDLLTEKSYRYGGSIFVELMSAAGVSALTNLEIKDIIESVEKAIDGEQSE